MDETCDGAADGDEQRRHSDEQVRAEYEVARRAHLQRELVLGVVDAGLGVTQSTNNALVLTAQSRVQ